jgi:hypothetical protein
MTVVTSFEPEWLDPLIVKPPQGSQVNLLTTGGVQVEGIWKENSKFLAWSPRLKMQPWLKQRLQDSYLPKFKTDTLS